MTHIYLAYPHGGCGLHVFRDHDWAQSFNVLVAMPCLAGYLRWSDRLGYRPRRTMLDSGAFSAWKSGTEIDINDVMRESKRDRWTEAVGLDVIGSWAGSKQNAIKSRVVGSDAMPVFHIGDPWELLEWYCEHWPKVGLSCRFGEPVSESTRFYEQCFARAWPHRFHSFGWTDPRMLLRFPFHSADSSTWMLAPLVYASSVRIRGASVGLVRGLSSATVTPTIKFSIQAFTDLDSRLTSHWRAELAEMRSLEPYAGD